MRRIFALPPAARSVDCLLRNLTCISCLLVALSADARPKIREGFFLVYPLSENTRLDTGIPSAKSEHCGVCHYDFDGGGNRNPFGYSVQTNLSKENQAIEYSNVVWKVRLLDSDGDGFDNETEITSSTTVYPNAPTFPGYTPANLNQVIHVDAADIAGYLVPATGSDTEPPEVAILQPNGGEVFLANTVTNIIWTSHDDSGVAGVSIYLSLDNGSSFTPLDFGVPSPAETNSYSWFPANRPSSNALIRIVAVDNASNSTNTESASVFSINSPSAGPATLRDFDMPGTQPHELVASIASPQNCAACHGNYNTNHEPFFNWQGSMMAHASIDPIYEANQAIANQDAPDSGDLCLRCHIHAGWVQGRSVPTSGNAMLSTDKFGVSCDLCHRMMDPIYKPGVSPAEDVDIIASLINPGTNYGNGMVQLDPEATRRGPFADASSAHAILVSPFHREGAFCGSCHDVSNPVFEKDENGVYQLNAWDAPASEVGPHRLGPVERTYSEWLFSEFNTPEGVYLPEFAGARTNGMVATCQDCHMRDIVGHGADTNQFPTVPLRHDLPLHDLTGGSTWLPMVLANLYPEQVNSNAVAAGVMRATYLLENAADLAVSDAGMQIQVNVTNNCGHKLPTGYPEGRRVWINVRFFDTNSSVISESGAYDLTNGILAHDAEARVYEVHPGIDTNISEILGIPAEPSFHFVLNNKIYEDNRIPPRGFSNEAFESFGGAPEGHSYADGQFWDEALYSIPEGAKRAEVRLYYQSTSREFVEFLRTNNLTNGKGQLIYDLWITNDMCPPTLMQEATWFNPFLLSTVEYTPAGHFQVSFHCRPNTEYTIEYTDALDDSDTWHVFTNNGTHTPTEDTSSFVDDFTSNTSGSAPVDGRRFYRFRYTPAL